LSIEKLENRQLTVWIKEASFSNWPEDVEKLGALEKGQEAHINVPPEVFAQAWDATLADDVTTKQMNLTVRVDNSELDHLSVIAVSLDELSPPKKVELQSGSARLADAVSPIFWVLAVIYASYAVAKYFKVI
jgi:hypothetical protein